MIGVQTKLGRAKRHLSELENALGYGQTPNCHFAGEFNRETRWQEYRVEGLPVIQPEWAAIAGEVVFGLRSALDHLMYQLVLIDRNKLPLKQRGDGPGSQTYFPIHLSEPKDHNGNSQPLTNPPIHDPDIIRALTSVQPYNKDGLLGFRDGNMLYLIDELCRVDKHRLLFTAFHTLEVPRTHWLSQDDPEVIELEPHPLVDGDVVARFQFLADDPQPDFDPHLTLHVCVSDGPKWLSNITLISLLQSCCGSVEDVVFNYLFRPFFPGEPSPDPTHWPPPP